MAIILKEVVPWGRSAAEYCAMFDLSESDLSGKILGVGDGPASFNAELSARGLNIVSIDPIYDFTPEQITYRVEATHQDMVRQVWADADGFVWDRFANPDDLGQTRLDAMKCFLADFEIGRKQRRYIAASLPVLPFEDKHFDLALCSHLLFLYTGQLSLDFHIQSITEVCRVAREVRIFPLLDLARNRSAYIDQVCEQFKKLGYSVEINRVGYEFQRGGNQMMKIKTLPNMEITCL